MFKPDNNSCMVSFDVMNLHQSIDIKELAEIINSKIKNSYDDNTILHTFWSATNLVLVNFFLCLINKYVNSLKK